MSIAPRLARDAGAAQHGDLLPVLRQSDGPAEEQERRGHAVLLGPFAEPEDVGALEKELPLLREEEAVGRQVELLLVGLDLGEIGVDRQVGGHVRRQPVLQIDARVGRSPERGRGLLLVAAPDDIGHDLELLPLREAREPGQVAEIGDLQPAHIAIAPEDGGPEALLPLPGDGPSEIDPPGLALEIVEAQGTEGNGDLGGIPPRSARRTSQIPSHSRLILAPSSRTSRSRWAPRGLTENANALR